jgi:polyisoprenoid-binding protein YceI
MTWQIDFSHSQVNFKVRHMMISTVRGSFESFSGTVNYDEANPTNTTVDIAIDITSINTREVKRDDHLRSADFFDAETYPVMTFKSTNVERIDDLHGKLTGDLTIRGVTNSITLDVTYEGQAKSPWGTTNAGFTATGTISRKQWGMEWNAALETGGFLVGDAVTIDIELEIIKQPEAEAVSVA